MAGFSTYSDLTTEWDTKGKRDSIETRLVSANAASVNGLKCFELISATGNPGAFSFSGTGTGTQMTRSLGKMPLNGNVSTDLRYLSKLGIYTTVTTNWLMLCDFLCYWNACVVTGTPTTLASVALPRYTDGVGVRGIVTVASALGAATPQLTLTCTDDTSASVSSGAMTAQGNSAPVCSFFHQSAGAGGPFIPMTGAGAGLKSIDSYTIDSGGTTGTVRFMLVKPLAIIPFVSGVGYVEKDFLGGTIGAVQIKDDACLGFIGFSQSTYSASSVTFTRIEYTWG